MSVEPGTGGLWRERAATRRLPSSLPVPPRPAFKQLVPGQRLVVRGTGRARPSLFTDSSQVTWSACSVSSPQTVLGCVKLARPTFHTSLLPIPGASQELGQEIGAYKLDVVVLTPCQTHHPRAEKSILRTWHHTRPSGPTPSLLLPMDPRVGNWTLMWPQVPAALSLGGFRGTGSLVRPLGAMLLPLRALFPVALGVHQKPHHQVTVLEKPLVAFCSCFKASRQTF